MDVTNDGCSGAQHTPRGAARTSAPAALAVEIRLHTAG